jgi:hypothetical protein
MNSLDSVTMQRGAEGDSSLLVSEIDKASARVMWLQLRVLAREELQSHEAALEVLAHVLLDELQHGVLVELERDADTHGQAHTHCPATQG